MLVGEELAGAADAGLDLVEDQQQAVLVAQRAQAPQEVRRRSTLHAALALDRLDQERAGSRADRGLHGVEVAGRDLVEAVDLRPEALDVFGLSAGGDRRQRAPVKGAFESHDAVSLGMAADRLALARHLDRRLVGLGARIGEEDQIGEGRLGQPPRQTLAFRDLEEIGGVPELAGLGRQRLDEMRMGMAERGHGDAGAEIEIALARRRRQPAAVAALESDVGSRVDRHDRRWHGLAPSKAAGATPRDRAKTKTPPRWDGL